MSVVVGKRAWVVDRIGRVGPDEYLGDVLNLIEYDDVKGPARWAASGIPCPICECELGRSKIPTEGRGIAVVGEPVNGKQEVVIDPVPPGYVALGCKPCWVTFWMREEDL